MTLSNGYAGASNASGVYSILVPAGSYTASAADAARNCASASPSSAPVTVVSAGTATQNFIMTGTSKLEANTVTVDDTATGNGNNIINRDECTYLKIGVKNNGCAKETAISATLTTSTTGVTVVDNSATYPDLLIDASSEGSVPFKIRTSSTFVCGTNIALSLNLTYASGTKSVPITVPTCAGGPNQTIPSSSITNSDLPQTDRLGRDGTPSTCAGKTSPGGIGTTGTRHYKTWTFTNSGGAPACFTVTINAAAGGAGDIESAAYLNVYNPAHSTPTTSAILEFPDWGLPSRAPPTALPSPRARTLLWSSILLTPPPPRCSAALSPASLTIRQGQALVRHQRPLQLQLQRRRPPPRPRRHLSPRPAWPLLAPAAVTAGPRICPPRLLRAATVFQERASASR